jgi:hypothetical protein
MTREELDHALKALSAKADKEGFHTMPEGTTLTLYASHDGGTLTVSRVDSVKSEGDLVLARTHKKELFVMVRSDLFALGTEGQNAQTTRRTAGFGG